MWIIIAVVVIIFIVLYHQYVMHSLLSGFWVLDDSSTDVDDAMLHLSEYPRTYKLVVMDASETRVQEGHITFLSYNPFSYIIPVSSSGWLMCSEENENTYFNFNPIDGKLQAFGFTFVKSI